PPAAHPAGRRGRLRARAVARDRSRGRDPGQGLHRRPQRRRRHLGRRQAGRHRHPPLTPGDEPEPGRGPMMRRSSTLYVTILVSAGLIVGRLIPPLAVRFEGHAPVPGWSASLLLLLLAALVGGCAW